MAIIKHLKSIASAQLLRIANEAGYRQGFSGLSSVFQVDHGIDPLADNNGRIITRQSDQYGYLDSGNANGGDPLGFHSSGNSGYVNLIDFGINPTNDESLFLQKIYGYNNHATDTFYILVLIGTLASFVNGKKPAISIVVPAQTNFELEPVANGGGLMVATNEFTRFINGIQLDEDVRIAVSTTGDIYTEPPASPHLFFLHYNTRTFQVIT